jgi:hypothetical protein
MLAVMEVLVLLTDFDISMPDYHWKLKDTASERHDHFKFMSSNLSCYVRLVFWVM